MRKERLKTKGEGRGWEEEANIAMENG